MTMSKRTFLALRPAAAFASLALLGGCNAVLLDPAGDVARQQRDLLVTSTWLMLLIIVPVMILTVIFAWRYRASATDSTYDPHFDHSTHSQHSACEYGVQTRALGDPMSYRGPLDPADAEHLEPFEVFRQEKDGDPMIHGGNVMAPDAELAMHYAREMFGRRQESVRLWVVRRADSGESVVSGEQGVFKTHWYCVSGEPQ